MPILKKFILLLTPLIILGLVIYFIEPPKSWESASTFQILVFFIPLLCTLTFFINLFLSYLPHSFIISLGLMLLTILWSSNQFNFISVPIILLLIFLGVKFFPKLRYGRLRLTGRQKIPKLTKLGRKR